MRRVMCTRPLLSPPYTVPLGGVILFLPPPLSLPLVPRGRFASPPSSPPKKNPDPQYERVALYYTAQLVAAGAKRSKSYEGMSLWELESKKLSLSLQVSVLFKPFCDRVPFPLPRLTASQSYGRSRKSRMVAKAFMREKGCRRVTSLVE